MIFDPILDIFRGKAVTIPPMDGALKPNNALDEADVLAEADAPDNLCSNDQYLFFSSGHRVLAIEAGDGAPYEVAKFDSMVTALAAAPGRPLAIGLDDGTLRLMFRTETPSGMIGEAVKIVRPDDKDYAMFVRHLGGIRPGEGATIPPFPAPDVDPDSV